MVDDDDLVTHDEVLVSAPRRVDLDQRGRDLDDAHARRHHGSDAHCEVDVIRARHVAAGEDGLLNLRALLRGQIHADTGLTGCAASLTRALALLRRLARMAVMRLTPMRRLMAL